MSRTRLQKLGPRHEEFLLHRMRGLTLHDAYRLAGFGKSTTKNYKGDAWHLENDPLVKERKRELLAAKFKALHMDVDEILARAAMIARSDVRELFDGNGALINPADLPQEAAAAVAGIETFEEFDGKGKDRVKVGDVRKVRLRDPMPAIRLLAEHKKLVSNPAEAMNSLVTALADRLKAARERKRKEQTP